MADKNFQPIRRRSTDRVKFHNPRNPAANLKASNPNSKASRSSFSEETTSSNWKNVDEPTKDTDGHKDVPMLVGTCFLMCPEEERATRERLRDLSVFERLHGNPAKSSPHLAVKKFCRTITSRDMKASDVRPIAVLEDTLNYLLNLLNSNEYSFEVVHDFLFDRIRCIRQDLSMQNAMGDQVIHMYERMIKFHIISQHHLHKSRGSPNIASMSHLNMEQLMKALVSLLNLYEANCSSNPIHKNEAEFYSLYVLAHLGSNKQDVESLSLWFRRIPSLILMSKEMCFARRILRFFRLGNYKRCIQTVEKDASSLQYFIVEPHIHEVRLLALSCVSYGGYRLQPYPLEHLSKLLIMKESEVESFCIQCGLEISSDGIEKGLLCTKKAALWRADGSVEKYYPMDSKRVERFCAELSVL